MPNHGFFEQSPHGQLIQSPHGWKGGGAIAPPFTCPHYLLTVKLTGFTGGHLGADGTYTSTAYMTPLSIWGNYCTCLFNVNGGLTNTRMHFFPSCPSSAILGFGNGTLLVDWTSYQGVPVWMFAATSMGSNGYAWAKKDTGDGDPRGHYDFVYFKANFAWAGGVEVTAFSV